MDIKLEFNWHDKWFGVYDKVKTKIIDNTSLNCLRPKFEIKEQHVWICIIPCLPIHIWWKIIEPKETPVECPCDKTPHGCKDCDFDINRDG